MLSRKTGHRVANFTGLGYDVVYTTAHAGKVDLAFVLGETYTPQPGSAVCRRRGYNSIQDFLSTTLNQDTCWNSGETIILPVAARDEEKQSTTQESMFNFVRMSDGGIVRLNNVRSETDVITDLAIGVLEEKKLPFKKFKDHQNIRSAIADIIPGFEKIRAVGETKEEFQIEGRTFHQPVFATVDGKAMMKVVSIG
jgi:nucleoside 2-deoxyribosyltransferase